MPYYEITINENRTYSHRFVIKADCGEEADRIGKRLAGSEFTWDLPGNGHYEETTYEAVGVDRVDPEHLDRYRVLSDQMVARYVRPEQKRSFRIVAFF